MNYLDSKPPGQPDVGDYWKNSGKLTVSGIPEGLVGRWDGLRWALTEDSQRELVNRELIMKTIADDE